jgi:hypothetical protein
MASAFHTRGGERYLTIVNLSETGAERAPAEFVAVMISVQRPSGSLLEAEIRPWKRTKLVPAWPAKESVPVVTLRVQRLRFSFSGVLAAHLRPTLRPLSSWVNLKLTDACSLSENENVVPVGGRFLGLLVWASLLPSRQREAD